MKPIFLPRHKSVSVARATKILRDYYSKKNCQHVFDLFDAPIVGGKHRDRDKFEALDLLSLGALNARVTSENLKDLWLSKELPKAEKLLVAVPHGRLEQLPENDIDGAAQALARVAETLEKVTGWKATRVGKLLHRMRPGLAPIYDNRVGRFYRGKSMNEWAPWYGRVMREVWASAPALQAAIDAIPAPFNSIPPVRAWDVLLWWLAPNT